MQRILLTVEQREELEAMLRKHSGSAAQARRARCVLLWADGERRVDIRSKLACNDAFVTRWTTALVRLIASVRLLCQPGDHSPFPTSASASRTSGDCRSPIEPW